MKIKELKELIANLPDNGQVWAVDKITGNKMPFNVLMTVWTDKGNVNFELR